MKEKPKTEPEDDPEKNSPKKRLERLWNKGNSFVIGSSFLISIGESSPDTSPDEKSNAASITFVPLSPIFENLRWKDFYQGTEKSFKQSGFIENNENWDSLGEVTGLNTNEKLDYQICFDHLLINDHFNKDDYGVLEWRLREQYTSVQKIYDRKTRRIFVLRTINLERFRNDPSDYQNELRTLSLLTQFPHRNIFRLVSSRVQVSSENGQNEELLENSDYFSEPKGNQKPVAMYVSILGEYGVANLKEFGKIRKKLNVPWTESELLILLKEISSSLAHCESLGVAHRNIKPSNIFFGEDKVTLKIADFKMSMLLDKKQKIVETNVVGTPRYMSYELKAIYKELKVNRKKQIWVTYDPYLSDVSSLGLVILELMLMSLGTEKETKLEVEQVDYILEQTHEEYPYITKILKGMLNIDTSKRPRFSEIEKLLQLPDEKTRFQVYESRYKFNGQIDTMKKEEGICANVEEYHRIPSIEIATDYFRLALSELISVDAKRKTSSSGFRSRKGLQSRKSDSSNSQTRPILKFDTSELLHFEETVEILTVCFEKFKKEGDYQNALAVCIYMRESFEHVYASHDFPPFAWLFNNLAHMNYILNNLLEGVDLITKASNVFKKVFGDNHLFSTVLFNNAGNLHYAIKQTGKAKEFYQKSLRFKESLNHYDNFSYAISLHNFANLKLITRKFDTAEDFYQQALKIYNKSLEKPKYEIAELYLARSMLHYAFLDNREKGEEYINLALDIFEGLEENDMKKNLVGTAYFHLGVLHYCFQEYSAAKEAYIQALGILDSSGLKKIEVISLVKEQIKVNRTEAKAQAWIA